MIAAISISLAIRGIFLAETWSTPVVVFQCRRDYSSDDSYGWFPKSGSNFDKPE